VRFVVSNNGKADGSACEVGALELFRLGATPDQWTGALRPSVRGVQRNVFTTRQLRSVIAIGVIVLLIAGRLHSLLILIVAPAYYLIVQSAFHTEYRYVLAVHHFLFVLAAVTLYLAGILVWEAAGAIAARLWGRSEVGPR
jgi:hypothetical protein